MLFLIKKKNYCHMETINENNKPKLFVYAFIFIIICLTYINYVNGARIGLLTNIIVYVVIALAIFKNNLKYLLIYYLINHLLGPTFFVEIEIFPTLGRLDYLISNLVFLNIVLTRKINTTIVLLIAFLFLSGIINIYSLEKIDLNTISLYYSYLSKITEATILAYIISNIIETNFFIKKIKYNFINTVVVFLLVSFTLLSIIQLVIPISVREVQYIPPMNFLGFNVYRPSGFLGAYYVYSISLSYILVISMVLLTNNILQLNKFMKFYLLTPLLLCATIANRSTILAFLLFFVLILVKKIKLNINPLIVAIVILLFFMIVGFYTQDMLILDQSNNTKILLWAMAINDILYQSDIMQIVFGHGVQSSSLLAINIEEYMSINNLISRYDDNIYNGVGFPIHNIFIQILYENGIIVFMIYFYIIYYGLKSILLDKQIKFIHLLFIITLTHAFFHNAIFSPILILLSILLRNSLYQPYTRLG